MRCVRSTRGHRGAETPCLGIRRGAGTSPPNFFFLQFLHSFLAVFRHMVFTDGFLISVKELGLLTNTGQWIKGSGCHMIIYIYILYIYIYCIVNNEDT
jgi:hypothetical protein